MNSRPLSVLIHFTRFPVSFLIFLMYFKRHSFTSLLFLIMYVVLWREKSSLHSRKYREPPIESSGIDPHTSICISSPGYEVLLSLFSDFGKGFQCIFLRIHPLYVKFSTALTLILFCSRNFRTYFLS